MKPEYKPSWARSHDLLEQKYLLPKRHSFLVQKMIHEAQVLENELRRFMIETEPKSFYIKEMKGKTSFWEIEFSQPVIQYVPSCFRFLTGNTPYKKENYQFAEYVPSYIPNLNHIALFVNYNQRNPEFSNNHDGILKKYVHEGGQKMNFSSLNLLYRWNHKIKPVDQRTIAIIKSSFENCYWNLPSPLSQSEVSCIDNLIYSKSKQILRIWMTRKTLVKIISIGDGLERRPILGEDVSVKYAQILVLTDDGNQLRSEKMSVFLTEDVADSVSENDIFNAVLANEINSNSRIGRTIVIGKIGKIVSPNNMKSLISLVLWKMLQTLEDNSSPTLVGTINQVKSEITSLIQTNSEIFSSENFSSEMLGWTKDLPKKISQSIEELSPLFFEDDEKIYQLSSVLLGFIASNSPENIENKEFLLGLVKLFDTIKVNTNFWGHDALMRLRTSTPYASLQSSLQHSSSFSTQKVLDNLPRLLNRIVYSRIFSQHYTHW
jgi:hypothetical protein